MPSNRDHVRRLSRRMQYATAIVAAVVLAGTLAATVWAFADPDWFSAFLSDHYGNRNLPVSTTSAALLLLLFCIQIGVFLYALDALRRAFGAIADDETINAQSGVFMRRAGLAFAASAGVMVLLKPLASVIYSVSAPPGQRFLAITFGSAELLTLLVSGILVVIGHLIAVAAEIDDDNRQIV